MFFVCFVFFLLATEIRCQEKSKGGLCYEVILGQPVAIPPLKQNKIPTMTKKVSAAEIERKLSEAEKRRLVRIIAHKYPLQPPLGINDSQQCFRYNGFCSPSLSFSLAIQELEAKKCADWTAKKNRIEEASRKKTEMDKEFSNQAREILNAKMDNYGENREAIMADMKDKLKVCQ